MTQTLEQSPKTAKTDLIYFESHLAVEKKAVGNRRIKGFFAVAEPDRHLDFAPVSAFNVPQFMAAGGPILVNHDLWRDKQGNKVEAGKALSAFPAEVRDIGSEDDYGILDLTSNVLVDTFPKSRNPALRPGDQGIFTVGEITQEEVWSKVQDGTLNGLSWKGLAKGWLFPNGVEIKKMYDSVDVWEYSLVTVPDQPKAMFVVAKTAIDNTVGTTDGNQPLIVQAVQLSKSAFSTQSSAEEWVKSKNYKTDYLYETYNCWIYVQNDLRYFDQSNLLMVDLVPGVSAIIGRLSSMPEPVPEMVSKSIAGVKLSSSEVDELARVEKCSKESHMAEATKVETATTPEAQPVKDTVAKSAVDEVTANLIADKVAEKMKDVMEKMPDVFVKSVEQMVSKMVEMGKPQPAAVVTETKKEEVAAVVETPATATTEVAAKAATPSLEDQMKKFKEELLGEVKSVVEQVAKSAIGTPLTEREEVVQSAAQAAKNEDKNSVFDDLIGPMIGKR